MELSIIYGEETKNCLPRDSPAYKLIRFADSNFAGDPNDCKSMIGYCFFLKEAVVSWCIKKQITVSTLTTEVEYITLGHVAREVV